LSNGFKKDIKPKGQYLQTGRRFLIGAWLILPGCSESQYGSLAKRYGVQRICHFYGYYILEAMAKANGFIIEPYSSSLPVITWGGMARFGAHTTLFVKISMS